ncbi:MAG: hypothetical protein ACYTDW_13170 [Planctomycetota bacterium]|jgi:hypothetical protein
MNSHKHFITALTLTILTLTICENARAKSVYVISNTETSQLQAYEVQDANLILQANYICESDPIEIVGAVGLAIDESEYGQFLFATFESGNKIEQKSKK